MPLEYSNTLQRLNFGAILSGLTQKSIMFWMNIDAYSTYYYILSKAVTAGKGWYMATIANNIYIYQYWTPGSISWFTSDNSITTGASHHIAVTYDRSSSSNNALIYIDGTSRSVSRSGTPSGSALEEPTDDFYVGSIDASGHSIDGKISGLCIYNRILSAPEVLDACNSRLAIPDKNGLVFAPNLSGAAGLQVFDGASLAAGNTIADQINGYSGVPTGSPVGIADTLLTYR